MDAWEVIEAEARAVWDRANDFPIRAYSEYMPAPYVGIKPYAAGRGAIVATLGAEEIDEYEQAHELAPGLDRIAAHVIGELTKLQRGEAHALSRTLLDGNAAWPPELAAAAKAGALADEPVVIAMALALSRTQDDKGNDRWTLFGTSHDGPAAPVWHGLDEAALDAMVRWAGGKRWAVYGECPVAGHSRTLPSGEGNERSFQSSARNERSFDTVVTFTPFAQLPAAVRAAYLARRLRLFPSPASLVFFEHPRYRALAGALPRATQIPLLHLFPRVEDRFAIRIPQSGWLDEGSAKHKVAARIVRSHRWQRVARDQQPDGAFHDHVSTALFSVDPDVLGLYDKPLAKNAEIWTHDYRLLLDGPRADAAQIARASSHCLDGGRFGYRMAWPPMRAGLRDVFWHLPLVAKAGARYADASRGYLTAERAGAEPLRMEPHLLARPAHRAAAALPASHGRPTASHDARKLLEASALVGAPLDPAFARALLRIGKHAKLDAWLARAAPEIRACVGAPLDPGDSVVLHALGTRTFEERIWRSIANLSETSVTPFRQKSNADGIACNTGKTGGPAARAAHLIVDEHRDLDALGAFLHDRYAALIEAHGMTGRAECVDHAFRWETDFAFPWMEGWAGSQRAPRERNLVVMIPGKNRGEAVIMADHYDTAYMEDCYDADRGGDTLRAPACGADDNHSATTALMLAAEELLPLARAGKLERDVWLVHLTGEEFPGDSLGARALCQGLVERRLAFTSRGGAERDVSHVRVMGAYILDMIGHNTHRELDVFQIAPGEGAASLALAFRAHRATARWNRACAAWNQTPARRHLARAQRVPDHPGHGAPEPPPPFAHLPLHGEVRVEWEPASALYNTDGQVFSDLGIPVVLFMENYDISRTGYHDTLDTMANIDLDYCAAMTAIAIESVADAACATRVDRPY